MTTDPLKQYITLRTSLVDEKARLEQRLQQINAVFSADGGEIPTPSKVGVRPSVSKKRTKGRISLMKATLQLTKNKPLTKQEILDGAKKLGWVTTSKKPLTILNPILYGKKSKFKNQGGKFNPK